ncbi:flavin-containing monooxygenase FMO GS-OX-like 3 [Hibiscus syriacus]|uniref:flavin-containing monooxygenase FMO GS-OX-like 3 n=1 Tax=Hibiscus syriacus TaxID=106335 RepID=UPI001921C206|nr:flavin-containing monooxygenase FMO GS-OX-like 3 [Hibiscus syriacus]
MPFSMLSSLSPFPNAISLSSVPLSRLTRPQISSKLLPPLLQRHIVLGCGQVSVDLLATVPSFPNPDDKIKSINLKLVVLIGNGPSAVDILKEISPLAKQVHMAVRTPFKLLKIECAYKDGNVENFKMEQSLMQMYKYHYPFLKSNGIVTVDDNRVGPLYKHVFPPTLAPWLSFVGLIYRVVIFKVMELQAKWVAKVLSGTLELPSQKDMASSVEQLYRQMENTELPKHHTQP